LLSAGSLLDYPSDLKGKKQNKTNQKNKTLDPFLCPGRLVESLEKDGSKGARKCKDPCP